MAELSSYNETWLRPVLQSYGASQPLKSQAGGWTLAVTTPKGLQTLGGTLDTSQAELKKLMVPLLKPLPPRIRGGVKVDMLPKPVGARVPAFWRVGAGAFAGVDMALEKWTNLEVGRELKRAGERQRREQYEEDVDVMAAAQAAAQTASARAATRVRQKTMRRVRGKPRVMIHAYSRRTGKTARSVARRRGRPRGARSRRATASGT